MLNNIGYPTDCTVVLAGGVVLLRLIGLGIWSLTPI